MKKTLSILLVAITFLSACSNSMQVDKPNLSEEKVIQYQTVIKEGAVELKNKDLEQEEKVQLLFDIGLAHSRLGDYGKALDYYDQVLTIDPAHFQALNNAAALYEELDMYTEALEYLGPLHANYKDNTSFNRGVVDDTVRVLVKNNQFDDAQLILEDYASKYSSEETIAFISETFDFIRRSREKHQEELAEEQ